MIGLVWNSMMSMAGGWFFLTVNEAFTLGDHDFRLPGIGSYMSVAIDRGDGRAMAGAALAMIVMIVVVDQLLWRPLLAWAQKFKLEETEASDAHDAPGFSTCCAARAPCTGWRSASGRLFARFEQPRVATAPNAARCTRVPDRRTALGWRVGRARAPVCSPPGVRGIWSRCSRALTPRDWLQRRARARPHLPAHGRRTGDRRAVDRTGRHLDRALAAPHAHHRSRSSRSPRPFPRR